MTRITLEEMRKNPSLLEQVPAHEQTYALCLAAVGSDGSALRHVHRQTAELCFAAVQSYAWALDYVEPRFQTRDVRRVALSVDGGLLAQIHNPSAEDCMAAVKRNGEAIQFVPDQTPELCLAAIQNYAVALRHIQSQTVSLCLAAVQRDGFALASVKLPMDRLIDPASEQLQNWCQVLSATELPSGTMFIEAKLRHLADAIPLGEKYRQQWLHPAQHGDLMLDLVVALAADMTRLVPDDVRINRFRREVDRQVELSLEDHWRQTERSLDAQNLDGFTIL